MAGGAPNSERGDEVSAPGAGGVGPGEESERFGHPIRTYRIAVSASALALAWARQENGPNGATVIVEREVSPLGRHSKLWTTPAESTLALGVVLRPPLSVEEADATWLLAALAATEGAQAASGKQLASWWPDTVLTADTEQIVSVLRAEIQLGPGAVRSAVATVRFDLDALGIPDGRDALLEAFLASLDRHGESLADGATAVAAAYEGLCSLMGRRVKVRLMPKGETRGVVSGVDRMARLALESGTGMNEKISIDRLRSYEVV